MKNSFFLAIRNTFIFASIFAGMSTAIISSSSSEDSNNNNYASNTDKTDSLNRLENKSYNSKSDSNNSNNTSGTLYKFGVTPFRKPTDPFSSFTDTSESWNDPFKSLSYKLKVATFNIWGLVTAKDRMNRVSAITRYFTKNPRGLDILCLQELWMADDYRTIRAALSLEFPHAHYFKSGVVGSGLAIFSKYPIIDAWWKGFTLTGKAHRLFDGDWYAGKGIGAVRLKHPVVGIIDVFNTHLIANYSPSDYDADWYKAHRATQLYELIRHVDRTSNPSAYTILMGDLNTQPIEDSYKSMLRGHELYTTYQKPLRNVWRDIALARRKQTRSFRDDERESSPLNQVNPDQWSTTTMLMSNQNGHHYTCNLRTNTYHQSSMPEQQIDHILYVPDGRIHCIDAAVFLTHPTRDPSGTAGPSYSDHAALMATFEIRPSDQVVLNQKKRRRSSVANPATQRLMVRLNEEIQTVLSQQWSSRVGAVICAILALSFFITGIVLLRKANSSDQLQKFLSIANAPDKFKWHEKISFNWYALVCLVFLVPLCLWCQALIWNAVVFTPQEALAMREFQYEWALWLRKH